MRQREPLDPSIPPSTTSSSRNTQLIPSETPHLSHRCVSTLVTIIVAFVAGSTEGLKGGARARLQLHHNIVIIGAECRLWYLLHE